MVENVARLSIRRLSKTFGSARVLTDVELVVTPGEVHGLAGQNGSGKSTLIKILTGVYKPDAGAEFTLDGQPMRLPVRWRDVHGAGVSVVHQDLGLLDDLNVADNICVGGFPSTRVSRRIERRAQTEIALRALRRVGAEIDPQRRIGTLNAAERAEVALARALRDHAPGTGVVIVDESTRALAGNELTRVHHVLRSLAGEGTSVILISHSLPELLAVTDRVSILRDGVVSGVGLSTGRLSEQEIARRMLGSDASDDLTSSPSTTPRTLASNQSTHGAHAAVVTGLTGGRVRDISFTVEAGEVVGITGLAGSGYEEIPYLMTAATRAEAGRLTCEAGPLELHRTSIAQCLRAGVVLVPEQRGQHGVALELSVRDNIALPNLKRNARRLFLGHAWQARDAAAAVRTFGIRPSNPDRLVKTLSGGNQQKVLMAKWFGAAPAVLVLHEPTQAVDIGARKDILRAIRDAADRGVGVLLVSGEPTDLCAVCDRILMFDNAEGLSHVDATTPDELLEKVYGRRPTAKVG